MINTYLYYGTDGIKAMSLEKMIEFHLWRLLLEFLEDWIQYNNKRFEEAINYIFENSDDLPDEFFDKFIEILDRYNKTEFALMCVRHLIERKKKERFEL